jgi:hypothetical protein
MNKTEDNYTEDTIDLRTLFRLFLKRKWWFIVTLIIVAALGSIYILRIPVLYEAKYKFSLRDNYIEDEYLIYNESQEKFTRNESIFIEVEDVPLIFETDLIFSGLENIPEIDDYETYIDSSLIKIDLDKDTSIFSLEVKNQNKDLAKKIGLGLIESLGEQIKNQDIEIFNNTIEVIDEDVEVIEEESSVFEQRISKISKEIDSLYSKMGGNTTEQLDYEIMEKKGEVLLYREEIISNESEIRQLEALYHEFIDQRDKVKNRIELLTEEPRINVENNRAINFIMVILLSLLTGLVVIIGVNYIYKLKQQKQ